MTDEQLLVYIDDNLPDFKRNRALAVRKILKEIVENKVSFEDLEGLFDDQELIQDNLLKVIKIWNIQSPTELGLLTAARTLINLLPDNATDYKTVGPTQIVLFETIWTETGGQSHTVFMRPLGVNKGEYGQGGDIVLSGNALKIVSRLSPTLSGIENDPNTYIENLGEIADGDYLTVINAEPNPYFVINDPIINWYFEFTQGGQRVLLSFVGPLGTYGDGDGVIILEMLDAYLYIVVDERVSNDLSDYQLKAQKAQANGYASLGADGKVPADQLPEGAGVDLTPYMTKVVYDPTNKLANAFNMGNMDETASKKILTDLERTKLANIGVTQPVDLDQMEIDIAALANGMVYKDDWNASIGTFPGGGTAKIGWFYNVSVGGTVNGIEFSQGDSVIAKVNNASTTTYAGNWVKKDQTDAVQSVAGLMGTITAPALRAALNVEDGADVTDAANVEDAITSVAEETLTDVSVLPFVKAATLVKITWLNFKATLKTYFDTLYVAVANFKEENLIGTATTNNAATGTLPALDFGTKVAGYYNLTGAITLPVTEPTMAIGETVTRIIMIKANGFGATLPTDITTNMTGTYDTAKRNLIAITYLLLDVSTMIRRATLTAL